MKIKPSKLADQKFRQAFAWAQLRHTIAAQVRLLREQHGWDQATLAKKIGTTQSVISRLENPNYGRYNMATLQKLANIFDLGMVLRFVSFSEIKAFAQSSSRQTLQPLNFDDENKNQPARPNSRNQTPRLKGIVPAIRNGSKAASIPNRIVEIQPKPPHVSRRGRRAARNSSGPRVFST